MHEQFGDHPFQPEACGMEAVADTYAETGTDAYAETDLGDLTDPVGGVIAVDLSSRFVRLCLSWSEPMVADLAAQEVMLRQSGGAELAERLFVQRFYNRLDPFIFPMVRVCVPLAQAESTLGRVEEVLRAQFGEVVRTAISFLLSHDRDIALQTTAVAATMAAREVRASVAEIISATRTTGEDG